MLIFEALKISTQPIRMLDMNIKALKRGQNKLTKNKIINLYLSIQVSCEGQWLKFSRQRGRFEYQRSVVRSRHRQNIYK